MNIFDLLCNCFEWFGVQILDVVYDIDFVEIEKVLNFDVVG